MECEKRERGGHKTLLGKKICDIAEIITNRENLAFINYIDRNSALGTKDAEFFDYYGYHRNENFFFLKDYVDIPFSNLIHVLKGKTVKLAGDEKFCTLLSDYLKEIEQEDIDVEYIELSQCSSMKETDILCSVYPWYGGVGRREDNPKLLNFEEELSMKNTSYTDYFSCAQSFVFVDLYKNRDGKKYSLKQLTPKGILLGRIPATSGNYFLRGILDGHPDILKWDYSALDDNLFLYCFRLAGEKAENVLKVFKRLYEEEYQEWRGADFTDWDKFEKSAKELLSLKDSFTSQELFVIFYLSYTEMMKDEKITDIGQKVIYWEAHGFPREDYPFLAKWLESGKINGQTIYMHRDHIVWAGSYYKFFKEDLSSIAYIQSMSANEMIEPDTISYQHWEEFHMRFEDMKLHPKEELLKICDKLGISWSDTMLKTTRDGEACNFGGVSDFDLKPVFNKYEEYLSEFDRFRISLISSPYQKKHGYTYENCMRFSRNRLWEIFVEKFRFQKKLQFVHKKDEIVYYICAYESLRWQLWETRKHAIKNDIIPQFKEMEIGQIAENPQKRQLEKIREFIHREKQLIMYGIGKDCEGILANLDDVEKERLIFCDLKAADGEIIFHGKKVIEPKELCADYKEYPILVTSSWYYRSIQYQLEEMGVNPGRITCNKISLWG